MKAVLLMGVAVGIFAHLFAAPRTEVISAQMRDSDPTVMDVKYRVSSSSDKVNVRVLAFEDGVRSFANVVRPTTFLEGSVIGDNVPANTVNSFAWKVSADWKVDLAKVSVEVLAQDVGAGLVPLDEVAFQTQRFQIRLAKQNIEIMDMANHSRDLGRVIRLAEIGTDAVFQVHRLADIDDRSLGILHQIAAGAFRQLGDFQFQLVIPLAHTRLPQLAAASPAGAGFPAHWAFSRPSLLLIRR